MAGEVPSFRVPCRSFMPYPFLDVDVVIGKNPVTLTELTDVFIALAAISMYRRVCLCDTQISMFLIVVMTALLVALATNVRLNRI